MHKDEVLLMYCGEALENCISAMVDLGAPDNLCELVEARKTLKQLVRRFGLKVGVFFSTLIGSCGE